MELDADALPDGATLECDLCIVGAGPAGLALAQVLAGASLQVLLLDGGRPGDAAHARQFGRVIVDADPHVALEPSRGCAVGGTAQLWNTPCRERMGAKYVPLDPIDLEAREGWAGAWPFARSTLDPFYRRAAQLCEIAFDFGDADAPSQELAPLVPPLASAILRPRFYRLGPAAVFTQRLPAQLRAAPDITLVQAAMAADLVRQRASERIEALAARTRNGLVHVRARAFVLAAGAIENARLLLAAGLGGEQVGRFFMEHPRDHSLIAWPDGPRGYAIAGLCDLHETPSGALVRGRLALDAEFLRREGLPNASLSLFPMILSPAAALIARLKRGLAGLAGVSRNEPGLASPIPLPIYPSAPDGWSRRALPRERFSCVRLLINLEQPPHPDNRIVLGAERDPLGRPLPALRWRWRAQDERNLARLHEFLKRELLSVGLGAVASIDACKPDPNAHHHAGTTRMGVDSADSVVDADGRMHGLENLYVTGSSVFPTAGFANPTLTIVALALRLGEHLRRTLAVSR